MVERYVHINTYVRHISQFNAGMSHDRAGQRSLEDLSPQLVLPDRHGWSINEEERFH
jgi:hypothetical protein